MERRNISSGTIWEERVGYSRAVRVGPFVYVTGTLGADAEGNIIGVGDPYAQTVAALEKIGRALEEAGAALTDVVRTRLFVTDLDQWERVADAHRDMLGAVRPCTTMVEVSRLFTPDALVEVEADAVITSADG